MRPHVPVIGWDIGGVNTKTAYVVGRDVVRVLGRPFELQRAPDALVPLLQDLARDVTGIGDSGSALLDGSFSCPHSVRARRPERPLENLIRLHEFRPFEPSTGTGHNVVHAMTMTAELSQMFPTKRDGVTFVIDAVESAFPAADVWIYGVDGNFLSPRRARRTPLTVAAANWAATARVVAAHHPDTLLIDVGTTTTDVIPIVGGQVVADGWTDPARLASAELVYTGALRTPAEAIASSVPVRGALTGVSAEGFALAGDVHLWRGDLDPRDYTVSTPDGRPATRVHSAERLARVVCADRELLDDVAVSEIADALAEAQTARITDAIRRVCGRHPSLRTAVVTGLGAFLGTAAARAAGLEVVPLAEELGAAAARCAPAVAVAMLLEQHVACSGHVAR